MNGKTRLPCHWNYFYFKVIYRLVLRNFIIFAAYLSVSVHFRHKPWEKAKSYLGEMNKSPWGFKRDYFSYSKTKKSHFLSNYEFIHSLITFHTGINNEAQLLLEKVTDIVGYYWPSFNVCFRIITIFSPTTVYKIHSYQFINIDMRNKFF